MPDCPRHSIQCRYNTTYNAQIYAQYFFCATKKYFLRTFSGQKIAFERCFRQISDDFQVCLWQPALPAVRKLDINPLSY